MRCCLILIIYALATGSVYSEEFGGPYQDDYQPPSQKDAQPRNAPSPDTQPRDAGDQPPQMRETGFYQAGPRAGAFEGPSGGVGLRGGGITLPEIKLGLPTIEFPSLFHSRRGARMVYKGGEAPWISTGFTAAKANSVAGRGTDDASSRAVDDEGGTRSRESDECTEWRRLRDEYQRKLDELDRRLEDCNKMSRLLQERLQAAAAVPPVDYNGQAELRRFPSAMGQSSGYERTPQHSVAQFRDDSQVQRASFSTAPVRRHEPALLRRLPQEEIGPIRYPNAEGYNRLQGSGPDNR